MAVKLNSEIKPYSTDDWERYSNYNKRGELEEVNMAKAPKAFSYLEGERGKVFMGFELETCLKDEDVILVGGRGEKAVAEISKIANSPLGEYVNLRREAYAAFEMVSIPATLNYHKEYLDKHLDMSEFEIGEYTGMHVHVSKDNFTKTSLKKFIVFISDKDNRRFIDTIAMRKISDTGYSDPIDFAWHVRKGKKVGCNIRIYSHWKVMEDHPYCKDVAVNTDTAYTVELRIFRSVNNLHHLFKNLEFVDAAVRFCKLVKYNDLNEKKFRRFVTANKKTYPNLNEFLKTFK